MDFNESHVNKKWKTDNIVNPYIKQEHKIEIHRNEQNEDIWSLYKMRVKWAANEKLSFLNSVIDTSSGSMECDMTFNNDDSTVAVRKPTRYSDVRSWDEFPQNVQTMTLSPKSSSYEYTWKSGSEYNGYDGFPVITAQCVSNFGNGFNSHSEYPHNQEWKTVLIDTLHPEIAKQVSLSPDDVIEEVHSNMGEAKNYIHEQLDSLRSV